MVAGIGPRIANVAGGNTGQHHREDRPGQGGGLGVVGFVKVTLAGEKPDNVFVDQIFKGHAIHRVPDAEKDNTLVFKCLGSNGKRDTINTVQRWAEDNKIEAKPYASLEDLKSDLSPAVKAVVPVPRRADKFEGPKAEIMDLQGGGRQPVATVTQIPKPGLEPFRLSPGMGRI